MHEHRKQSDGALRPGDNWQKGIPRVEYAKSLIRHMIDFWLTERGHGNLARADMQETLCSIMFNVMGYLFEMLNEKPEVVDLSE